MEIIAKYRFILNMDLQIMNNINQRGTGATDLEVLDVQIPNGELVNRETYALVDGMNVALARNNNRKARLGDILNVIYNLERSYDRIETYADASIRYRIDDIAAFDSLVRDGKIYLCPAGITADELIWQRAISLSRRGWETTIISNDMFPVKKYSAELTKIRNLTVSIIGESEIYLIERNIVLLNSRYKNSANNKGNSGRRIIY